MLRAFGTGQVFIVCVGPTSFRMWASLVQQLQLEWQQLCPYAFPNTSQEGSTTPNWYPWQLMGILRPKWWEILTLLTLPSPGSSTILSLLHNHSFLLFKVSRAFRHSHKWHLSIHQLQVYGSWWSGKQQRPMFSELRAPQNYWQLTYGCTRTCSTFSVSYNNLFSRRISARGSLHAKDA